MMQTVAVSAARMTELVKNSWNRSTRGVPRGPVASSIIQTTSCAVGAPNDTSSTSALPSSVPESTPLNEVTDEQAEDLCVYTVDTIAERGCRSGCGACAHGCAFRHRNL